MRIVLATPLYPPEIAEPAPYVKELAKRLSKSHEVTVVAYARLPEQVPNVSIISVDKRRPLPFRLVSYVVALARVARKADLLYAENGASVELPIALVALLTGRPLIFHIGDPAAHERAKRSRLFGLVERFAFSRAKKVLTDVPHIRPEIIPLEPFSTREMAAYEQSWGAHIRSLGDIFTYAG